MPKGCSDAAGRMVVLVGEVPSVASALPNHTLPNRAVCPLPWRVALCGMRIPINENRRARGSSPRTL